MPDSDTSLSGRPRSNGTRTFRRPSTTPFGQTATATDSPDSHLPSTNRNSAGYDSLGSSRFSKDELLGIYKHASESATTDVSHLLEPGWNPNQTNGSSSRGWGKTDSQHHIPQDPTVCWDASGGTKLISFETMTPEERELFATDVNSTLKIPQGKDNNQQNNGGQNGRKTSISMGTATNFPMSSPSTASRPGTRRRETADTHPFPTGSVASPTASRFSRDDWLPRRNTDLREPITDEPEEDPGSRELPSRTQAFGSLSRANTAGSAAFGASSSLWAASPGATTPSGIGAFGSFALNTSATGGEKRYGTGSSRLAHLMPKDSTENLGMLGDSGHGDTNRGGWRPRQRTDTDPFGAEGSLSGSAVLGGAQDYPTSHRGIFDTPIKGHAGDFGMSGLNLGGDSNGPHSPSETNPYRSPMADRDGGHEDDDMTRRGLSGMGSEQPNTNYATLPRSFGGNHGLEGSDRSQTSSVGAKGFPTVNTMTGWPAGPSVGTPDRERQPFSAFAGGGIFGPLGDLQSPGLGGLGNVFLPGTASSTIGRGSKLGSLFPAAMQAQMHGQDQDSLGDSVPDLRQGNPLGAIGRGAIGSQGRDTGSPVRSGRGIFDDYQANADSGRSFMTGEQNQAGLTSTAPGQPFPAGSSFALGAATSDPAAMKMMVMPDRMRWVYLDPQGTMQGPFNGLEMNDWYKANFFSPDLRVKRIEDNDFEPLGQLIRRIGNSREPFLVPQMGIPHGPAPAAPYTAPGSEAVPPLQNAFPSFGRTLTAAQQNDLERRKQEEQLYHARQREFAQHHQPFSRAPLPGGVPGSLHHHSSVHSLQSQPSFGSMTSPIGMAPQPPIGPLAPGSSFFDSGSMLLGQPTSQSAIGAGHDLYNPDLNQSERQMLASMQASGGMGGLFQSQPVGAPGNDGGLRSQLPSVDQLQKDPEGFSSRLEEFHGLRAQHDAQEAAAAAAAVVAAAKARIAEAEDEEQYAVPASPKAPKDDRDSRLESAPQANPHAEGQGQGALSLTERVLKTQADAAAAASKPVVQQPSIPGLPMSFPPPAQSSTPIAAPTAQRPASNLPTRYDDRSSSGTPDTTSEGAALAPPPTAPWAPQPGTESHKGPSLKEIQEAEAKKAAKKEEAAAAIRRAALEQEAAALREREKAAAVSVLGLPATSTWGTGSPVSTPAAGSAWKQPTASKGATPSVSSNTASKKTLADIQREEEVRKQKAMAAAAAVQTTAVSAAAMGKRYADLASKTSNPPGLSPSPVAPATASGWSTVGAGGKVKIPIGPAAQTRAASVGTIKTPAPPAASRSVSKQQVVGLKDAKSVAMEEFKKWLYRELGRGLIGIADSKW